MPATSSKFEWRVVFQSPAIISLEILVTEAMVWLKAGIKDSWSWWSFGAYTDAINNSSSAILILPKTYLPFGSVDKLFRRHAEFGFCNMQVPFECSVPWQKKIYHPILDTKYSHQVFEKMFPVNNRNQLSGLWDMRKVPFAWPDYVTLSR